MSLGIDKDTWNDSPQNFLAHILPSTHSHPGAQLMELFALELWQWERNGMNQVLALTSLLGSVMWHIFKLYWQKPRPPLQRREPRGGREQEEELWSEPTKPWGSSSVCPGEKEWEDHSLGLHCFWQATRQTSCRRYSCLWSHCTCADSSMDKHTFSQTCCVPEASGTWRLHVRCDPLWEWEAKPRDFRCYICFKPGALLPGGSVVPPALFLWGSEVHLHAAMGWVGDHKVAYVQVQRRPLSGPVNPSTGQSSPGLRVFPVAMLTVIPQHLPSACRTVSWTLLACSRAFPLTRWGCMSGRNLDPTQCWHWATLMQEAPYSQFTRNSSLFQGDSGSPLVCEFNHTWVQIGVVSWGKGCTYPMFPTVFARVSFFSRWIQRHIENTPLPLQPLPALSPTPVAINNILMTSLAALSML